MPIEAGKLRHLVVIERKRSKQDPETGSRVDTWEALPPPLIWAEIIESSVRDFIAASAEQSQVGGRIVIRYRNDVQAGQRVVYRGEQYQILGAMRDMESGLEYLTLPVTAGVRVTPP